MHVGGGPRASPALHSLCRRDPARCSQRSHQRRALLQRWEYAKSLVAVYLWHAGSSMEGFVFRELDEAEERWWWTTASIVLMLLLVGPSVRSPDGMEMLRITASWFGADVQVGDPHFWPPLWSLLNAPGVLLGEPVAGARWLNIVLWGAIAWPLHSAVSIIGGRVPARWAVVLYWCLPMLTLFASVLDARALGAFITTAFVASLIKTASKGGGLGWPVFWAALAPFARPEGILHCAVAVFVFWLMGRNWREILGSALAIFVPTVAFRGSVRGNDRHEQLFALVRHVVDLGHAHALRPSICSDGIPSFRARGHGHQGGECSTHCGRFSGRAGGSPGRRRRWAHGARRCGRYPGPIVRRDGFAAPSPQPTSTAHRGCRGGSLSRHRGSTDGQGSSRTSLSNYLFLMPTLIGLTALGLGTLRRWRWAPWAAILVIVAETNFTPLMTPAPYFLEGSESAALATVMLKRDPPASGSRGDRLLRSRRGDGCGTSGETPRSNLGW